VREFRLHGFRRGAGSNDRPYRASTRVLPGRDPKETLQQRRIGGGPTAPARCPPNTHIDEIVGAAPPASRGAELPRPRLLLGIPCAHGGSMRRRLERFLPIFVLALVMQILAPIAAPWATTIAIAADPLQTASICHADAGSVSGGPDRQDFAHDGLCAVCVSHVGAAVNVPRTHAIAAHPGQVLIVCWPEASAALASAGPSSNTQARGPPLSA
jgi:hypothetical protein